MKQCPKCGEDKPLSVFGTNRTTRDGLQSYCKSCRNAMQAAIRQTSEYREYYNAYMRRPDPKAKARARHRLHYRSEHHQEWRHTYRATNQDKVGARDTVRWEVSSGRIPPPGALTCGDQLDASGHRIGHGDGCGAPAQQYHHYLGYQAEHRLDVQAVCFVCHGKTFRAGIGA